MNSDAASDTANQMARNRFGGGGFPGGGGNFGGQPFGGGNLARAPNLFRRL